MVLKKRSKYDEIFKKQAVLQHLHSKRTLADSAVRAGITSGMLSKWVQRYSTGGVGQTDSNVEEIRRLKEQVRVLKEIVNKALVKKYLVHEIVDKMIDEPEKILIVDHVPPEKQ